LGGATRAPADGAREDRGVGEVADWEIRRIQEGRGAGERSVGRSTKPDPSSFLPMPPTLPVLQIQANSKRTSSNRPALPNFSFLWAMNRAYSAMNTFPGGLKSKFSGWSRKCSR
jgi:hypothetical protein